MSEVIPMPGAEQPEEGWKLMMEFDDQSPSFAAGFACGKFWQELAIEACGEFTVATENMAMFEKIAACRGHEISFEVLDEHWLRATVSKLPSRPRLVKS